MLNSEIFSKKWTSKIYRRLCLWLSVVFSPPWIEKTYALYAYMLFSVLTPVNFFLGITEQLNVKFRNIQYEVDF